MTQNGKTILIVEDEDAVRRVLKDILTVEGYAISEATDGRDGLDRALHAHPDLILLDIVMPKVDGIEMLKKLRADEWGNTAPVIVLTNLSGNNDISRAMEYGTFDFLVKTDIKIDDVITKIREKIGVRKRINTLEPSVKELSN